MRLKFFAAVFIVALCSGLSVTVPALAADETSVHINSTEQAKINSTIIVAIKINTVENLKEARFDIEFDSTILSLQSTSDGQMTGGAKLPVNAEELGNGLYRFTVSAGAQSVNGGGNLAVLTFYSIREGSCALTFSSATLSDGTDEIPATWTGTSIIIGDAEEETPVDTQEDLVYVSDTENVETSDPPKDRSGLSELDTERQPVAESDIKWPVLFGIIGGSLVLLGLVLYAKLRGKSDGYL